MLATPVTFTNFDLLNPNIKNNFRPLGVDTKYIEF